MYQLLGPSTHDKDFRLSGTPDQRWAILEKLQLTLPVKLFQYRTLGKAYKKETEPFLDYAAEQT